MLLKLYKTYCFIPINNENINEAIEFLSYISHDKLIREFEKVVIHLSETLSQDNFESMKGQIEELDRPNVTNYCLDISHQNILLMNNCEQLCINMHSFQDCRMTLNSKMFNLLDSFPLLDLLKGEHFT